MDIVRADYFSVDSKTVCEVTYIDGTVERFSDRDDLIRIGEQLMEQQKTL